MWCDKIQYLGMGIDLIAARIIKCSHCNAKHKFYRAFGAVSGKVGRSVSEEVIIQSLKTKCFPVLYYGLEVCPVTIETRLDRWTMLSTGALDKLFSTRDQSVIEERMMFSECHPVHYTTIGRKRKRKRKFLQKFRISPNQLCVLGLFKDKATADLELQYINSCITSGYATMVHGRGCNPHRSTTAFANLEITSL